MTSTERQELLARIQRLEEQIRDERFQARYRGVELEALYDVGLAITSTLNPAEVAEQILMRAISLLDARQGALFDIPLSEDDGKATQLALEPIQMMGELTPAASSLSFQQALENPTELFSGAKYALAQAITLDEEPSGLLVVADKESRHGVGPFPDSDSRTLALFAQQSAVALRNARHHRDALEQERIQRDLVLAAQIQQQLLPDALPEVDGYGIAAWSRPAREVGGDYYAAHRLEDGRLLLVIADVAGKGVPAALLVSNLDSALHLMLADSGNSLSTLDAAQVERLSRHIFERSLSNQFITFLALCLNPASGAVEFVNAGHNPGLVHRASGNFLEMQASGPPVGMFPAVAYRLGQLTLEPGDLLCLYTDGISECADEEEVELGDDGLKELLIASAPGPLHHLTDRIAERCLELSGDRPQADDQTLVLLQRRAWPG
ncbi:MAG: SpoIIE family protein phosphatase [Acidobacteriota bacterium]